MNNEIKEISDIISDNIDFCDVGGGSVSIDEDEVAKAIYDAGYHKIIWHKVADGDLPKEEGQYYVAIKFIAHDYVFYNILDFSENEFLMYDTESGKFIPVEEVIAWAELPEYKE